MEEFEGPKPQFVLKQISLADELRNAMSSAAKEIKGKRSYQVHDSSLNDWDPEVLGDEFYSRLFEKGPLFGLEEPLNLPTMMTSVLFGRRR
jgi:hypothetical protein